MSMHGLTPPEAEEFLAEPHFGRGLLPELQPGLAWVLRATVKRALVPGGFGSDVELVAGDLQFADHPGSEVSCRIQGSSVYYRGTYGGRLLAGFSLNFPGEYEKVCYSGACLYTPGSLLLGPGVLEFHKPITNTLRTAPTIVTNRGDVTSAA